MRTTGAYPPIARNLVGAYLNGASTLTHTSSRADSKEPLQKYENRNITLTLPQGRTLDSVRWISVWCRKFGVSRRRVARRLQRTQDAAELLVALSSPCPCLSSLGPLALSP